MYALVIAFPIYADSFQPTVWRTLVEKVPSGVVVTYGQLAEMCDMKKSTARAVGTAMRLNPVCLIIPCHRVIPASGGTGNYAGGKHVKSWLLQHERVM